MIQSMTGYGRGEKGNFVAEIRSFNHRFLDVSIRLPRSLSSLELRIKKRLQGKFSRGRLEVSITSNGRQEKRSLVIDKELANQYYNLLESLKKEYSLKGEVDLDLMASMKEFITLAEPEEDIEASWKDIEGALEDSMKELLRMRKEEGDYLREDILKRIGTSGQHIEMIEKRCPSIVRNYRNRLLENIKSVAHEIELDEKRIHFEVALFAERCDVTEELVRLRSHISQLRNMLNEGGAIGKKLDFLIQEIGREVNTISSKAGDADISLNVVEIKAELERIREQIQNIE
jgi:uncharacterized protein (TIGR00255 family)